MIDEQRSTEGFLARLIKLSPVPVEFTAGEPGYAGSFVHGGLSEYYPHIEIKNKLELSEKISALIHEIAHAICHSKNCKCMRNSVPSAEKEIHVFKFQLNWLLEHKQKEPLERAVEVVEKCLERDDFYAGVAKHIMKLKLWEKCVEFIK